jgi:TonB family protein
MKIYCLFFCSLLAGLFSSTCFAIQTETLEVTAKESCQEHIVKTPRTTMKDWPKRALGRDVNAYVVITYKLDGSGKATNIEVADSVPAGLFDKTTRLSLQRTKFTPGVTEDSCTYIRMYKSARRGGD